MLDVLRVGAKCCKACKGGCKVLQSVQKMAQSDAKGDAKCCKMCKRWRKVMQRRMQSVAKCAKYGAK